LEEALADHPPGADGSGPGHAEGVMSPAGAGSGPAPRGKKGGEGGTGNQAIWTTMSCRTPPACSSLSAALDRWR
jgi:hypothetical protein